MGNNLTSNFFCRRHHLAEEIKATMPRTFEDASREIQANLKKHLEKVQSSEEQELLEESNEIIEKVFNAYDLKNIQDSRTKEALLQSISSGSCLICISAVKKKR